MLFALTLYYKLFVVKGYPIPAIVDSVETKWQTSEYNEERYQTCCLPGCGWISGGSGGNTENKTGKQ